MKNMFRFTIIILGLVVFLWFQEEKLNQDVKIGIIQLVDHPSLSLIEETMIEQLTDLGYEKKQIDVYNAQGEISNIQTIVDNLKGKDYSTVIAITTPVAQIAQQLSTEVPIVFSAVSDPLSAKLTTSLAKPDQNITGTSDEIQVESILDLAQQITPYQTVGVIYNAAEINSVQNIKKVEQYCLEHDLTMVEATVSLSSDVMQATEILASKADIIFAPNDNTVATAMKTLAEVAISKQIPVYVGADSMVKDGALGTIGIDYADLGKDTAKMADQIIKGKQVEDIAIKVYREDLFIYLNQTTADKLNLSLPLEILNNEKCQVVE